MKNEPPKRNANRSRIALTEFSTDIVHSWRGQLIEEFAGIKISESDLTNWAIESIGGALSKRQLDDIKNKYFDEVKQLEWMLAQAKAARANQDHEGLSKLLGSLKRPPKREKNMPEQGLDTSLTQNFESPLNS